LSLHGCLRLIPQRHSASVILQSAWLSVHPVRCKGVELCVSLSLCCSSSYSTRLSCTHSRCPESNATAFPTSLVQQRMKITLCLIALHVVPSGTGSNYHKLLEWSYHPPLSLHKDLRQAGFRVDDDLTRSQQAERSSLSLDFQGLKSKENQPYFRGSLRKYYSDNRTHTCGKGKADRISAAV